MEKHRKLLRYVGIAVLAVVTIFSVVKVGRASGRISIDSLEGAWQASIFGFGGCGLNTIKVNFTLNDAGQATDATLVSHAQCIGGGVGNSTLTGQTFTIESLDSHGSGTAGLSCGPGCGFTYAIQVSPDRTVFNLVDITDPSNFWQGVAIHQSHYSNDD